MESRNNFSHEDVNKINYKDIYQYAITGNSFVKSRVEEAMGIDAIENYETVCSYSFIFCNPLTKINPVLFGAVEGAKELYSEVDASILHCECRGGQVRLMAFFEEAISRI